MLLYLEILALIANIEYSDYLFSSYIQMKLKLNAPITPKTNLKERNFFIDLLIVGQKFCFDLLVKSKLNSFNLKVLMPSKDYRSAF